MLLIKPTDIDIKIWNGPFGQICNEIMKIKDDIYVDLWNDNVKLDTYMDVVSKHLDCKKFLDLGYIGSSRIIDYNEHHTYHMMFITIINGENYQKNQFGSLFNPSIQPIYENIMIMKLDQQNNILHMSFEEILPIIEKKRLHKCVYVDENGDASQVTINNAWNVLEKEDDVNIFLKNYKLKKTIGKYILLILSNNNSQNIFGKGPMYILTFLNNEFKMLADFTVKEYLLLKKQGISTQSLTKDMLSNCEETQNINKFHDLIQK